jgi:hypothetical protein
MPKSMNNPMLKSMRKKEKKMHVRGHEEKKK